MDAVKVALIRRINSRLDAHAISSGPAMGNGRTESGRFSPPISEEAQGASRSPPVEFKALLGQFSEPYKAMVVIIACLGLRVSELLGLQWGDIDFENLTVKIHASRCRGQVEPHQNGSLGKHPAP